MKYFIFLISIFIWFGCDPKDTQNGSYPNGVISVNQTEENDCQLPECSEDRIIRLIAQNVEGEILSSIQGGFLVFYPFTFDSYITFRFCNLPLEFQKEGTKIKFSGQLLDACGLYTPFWPEEETYILRISKIELL